MQRSTGTYIARNANNEKIPDMHTAQCTYYTNYILCVLGFKGKCAFSHFCKICLQKNFENGEYFSENKPMLTFS